MATVKSLGTKLINIYIETIKKKYDTKHKVQNNASAKGQEQKW